LACQPVERLFWGIYRARLLTVASEVFGSL
jgi:hypothetical protein